MSSASHLSMASPSILPWAWIIEALADFKPADTDLLEALLLSVPDIMNDSFTNARERVSLRFLEEWLDSNFSKSVNRLAIYAPSSSGLSLDIGACEQSEDFLQKVATAFSLGKHGSELKYEVEQFIHRKRASLPASALDQLMGTFHDHNHPSAPYMKDITGHAIEDDQCILDKTLAGHKNNYKPAQRHEKNKMSNVFQSSEARLTSGIPENVSEFSTSRRGALFQQKISENEEVRNDANVQLQNQSSPTQPSSFVGEICGTTNGLLSLAEAACQQNRNETGGHRTEEKIQLDKLNCDVQPSSKRVEVPQNMPAQVAVTVFPGGSPKKFCSGESEDVVSDMSSSDGLSDKGTDLHSNDHLLLVVKQRFQSFQTQMLCIKCQGGGELLTCCSSGCGLAAHESCFGTPVSFDTSGKFYCPFCTYTRANSAYRRAKKRVVLSKKILSDFIGGDLVNECRGKSQPVTGVDKLCEAAMTGEVSHGKSCQNGTKISDNQIVMEATVGVEYSSEKSPCREAEKLNCDEAGVPLTSNRHDTSKEDSVQGVKDDDKSARTIEPLHETVPSGQTGISPTCDNELSVPFKDRRETIGMANNHQEGSGIRNGKHREGANSDLISETSAGTTLLNDKRFTRTKRQREVDEQDCSTLLDVKKEVAGSRNHEEGSNSGTKRQASSRHQTTATLPVGRRNKLLWSADEEEMLREGFNKFSGKEGKNIPWVKILEHGSHRLEHQRTTRTGGKIGFSFVRPVNTTNPSSLGWRYCCRSTSDLRRPSIGSTPLTGQISEDQTTFTFPLHASSIRIYDKTHRRRRRRSFRKISDLHRRRQSPFYLSPGAVIMSGAGAHVLVIPYPAQGHLIPLLDHAHQLSSRGLLVTVLVTTKNLPLLDPLLSNSPSIHTLVLPFPKHPSIPDGVENVKDLPVPYFRPMMRALSALLDPALSWARSHPTPPTAILSDIFVGWTHRLAADLGVPRLLFSPSGAFAISVSNSLWRRMPNRPDGSSDPDRFPVSFPELPGSPIYPWVQLSNVYRSYKEGDELSEFIKDGMVANMGSWGVVVNSFAELEGKWLEHLKGSLGHPRIWAVGPLHLQQAVEGGDRGGSSSVEAEEVMRWLEGREEGSVVFACFGSQAVLSRLQMEAVAEGLRRSGAAFVWCVKEPTRGHDADSFGVVPAGFEAAVAGRGWVIRGWAPQVAILSHRSVGAFLSHCGWNSVLEGIVGGVSFLAWPMGADQFVNAALLEETGVAVRVCEGAATVPDPDVLARAMAETVAPGRPRRARASELSAAALGAVAGGGSSVNELDALVSELVRTTQNS
ncbi:hypothetical protein H6P81_008575 [Aristolochia fimbriata]|uniref:Zinc finger PHD-type domain-containing protein n=1 Tax=Aristolochia fimbriata TaxID=158543 RepID=A0AAV7EIF6_ARIFI|nr:hypothetical protein H6P81_008575 [Aristolochia fimbriata]